MRFDHYAAGLLGLCSAALALKDKLNPILKPSKGEILEAGSNYTIEWKPTKGYDPGPVNLLLESGDIRDSAQYVAAISTDTKYSEGRYKWTVGQGLASNQTYYIKIGSIDDVSIVNYSPPFKIHPSNKTSSGASRIAISASTGLTTMVPSTTTSAPITTAPVSSASTATSTAAGMPTASIASAPIALIGAAAVGILAF
ncbi:uncharacterized protein N7459_010038 [Penicillium hispanicum]|uniref:uncharacterized protein n=1 Tax=Penicillium hispanicum TaxID=1080232 RepID=UPI00253FE7DA|nr:uncharacterized protein N7459_010038 [Penicillium hispanicum]KAJ5570608.1 hypothetical protein N7459_010038 [Penicillium hispanicum]